MIHKKVSTNIYRSWLLIASLVLLTYTNSFAQYFGTNKIQYKKINFEVLETPHFNIYHYFKNRQVVYNIADISELWYKKHKGVFDVDLQNKNPLIIYNNHADFSQTTLSPYNIDIGTGGVTEGLKNRIFMPVFESHQQTKHVIGHELVHAFQYDILKNTDSIGIQNIQNIPLWMVEGMAEYLSKGDIDATTALSIRDSYINNAFPKIKDLNDLNKYFPYKYGQAFWAFIASNWSKDIIKPLFINTAKYGYKEALVKTLYCTEDELSELWKEQMTYLYQPFIKKENKPIGREILDKKSQGDINLAPQLSPDGNFIAFFNEKDAISIDLYIAETKSGKIIKKISGHTEKLHIDEYNFIEDIGSWSPDGKHYIYTALTKGKTALIIVDVITGKTVDEITIKDLEYFSHPTYSPDGENILLTAIKDGITNLFLYNLKNKTIKQLSFDTSSKIQADWSPDGKKIIFASDSSNYTTVSTELKNYKTHILDLKTNDRQSIDILKGADNLNALFSNNGTKIYFLSSYNGFRNLFEYDLQTKEIFQLTDFITGISGITELSNAISISKKDNLITYVFFQNGKYNLYAAREEDFIKKKIDNSIESNNLGAKLCIISLNKITYLSTNEIEKLHEQYKIKPYKPNFSFTSLAQSAGIGVGTSATTSVTALGNIDMLYSDILDRNKLLLSLGVNGELYDIGGGIFYLNQTSRLNWSLGAAHSPLLYTYLDANLIKPKRDDAEIHYNYYKLRIFNESIGGSALFPIFKTLRIEAGLNASIQSYRVDRLKNIYKAVNINGIYYPDYYIKSENEKLNSSEIKQLFNFNPQTLFSLTSYLAYVGDNSIFGLTAPVKGHRYRFEVSKSFIGINSINLLADIRNYLFIKPITIAVKGIYIGRFGNNPYQLNTLYLGDEEFVRGYLSLYSVSINQDSSLPPSQQLIGSQLINTSIELRVPFSGPKQLALIESKMFFTDLALFFDAGSILGKPNNNFIINDNITINDEYYKKARTIASLGLALRFNLFGVATLEPYYAIPFSTFYKKPNFGFFISTGGW